MFKPQKGDRFQGEKTFTAFLNATLRTLRKQGAWRGGPYSRGPKVIEKEKLSGRSGDAGGMDRLVKNGERPSAHIIGPWILTRMIRFRRTELRGNFALAEFSGLTWARGGLVSQCRTRSGLQRRNKRYDFEYLQRVIQQYDVREIVVVVPLRMSGAEGTQSEKMQGFAEDLRKRFRLPVHLWDERLTSAEANRLLRETDLSIEKRGKAVDRMAAILILQGWMEQRGASASAFRLPVSGSE